MHIVVSLSASVYVMDICYIGIWRFSWSRW